MTKWHHLLYDYKFVYFQQHLLHSQLFVVFGRTFTVNMFKYAIQGHLTLDSYGVKGQSNQLHHVTLYLETTTLTHQQHSTNVTFL